jgi:hypothetical protein
LARQYLMLGGWDSKKLIRKPGRKPRKRSKQTGRLFYFVPDNVLVIAAVDEAIRFSVRVGMEENPAFDTFAEKEIGSFGEQLFLFV